MSETDKHPNDTYGAIGRAAAEAAEAPPPIPAATVVLLRDRTPGFEVLMLRKTSKITFGGMWVFPGGRIDAEDYPADGAVDTAARRAAARETREETGLTVTPDDFVWFAHWTPPPTTPKRFATWFFAGRAGSGDVAVDGGEIDDHRWIAPSAALERHAAREIDLAPPTWVTLYQLARYEQISSALSQLGSAAPRVYETRLAQLDDGVRVTLWHGDAGYDTWDATSKGATHRLLMRPEGFVFEHSAVNY